MHKNEGGEGDVLYSKDVYEQFKLVCRCRALTHVNLLKLMGPRCLNAHLAKEPNKGEVCPAIEK